MSKAKLSGRGRASKPKAVAVFVDYENVRRRLKDNFGQDVAPANVAKALHPIASEQGQFRFGEFYGDWSLRPEDGRAIEAQKFKAEHVIRTPGGKDRTDAAMLVELGDQADSKDFAIAVIATGDADFTYAIRKLREKGKSIVVVAVSIDAARELLTVADTFIPIEKHLGLEFKAAAGATSAPRWQPFVSRMLSLEQRLPYVVRSYLRDRGLNSTVGAGDSVEEREAFWIRPGKRASRARRNRESEDAGQKGDSRRAEAGPSCGRRRVAGPLAFWGIYRPSTVRY